MAEKIAVISYRREDSADVTGRIYDRLVAAFGKDAVFKDVHSIPLGLHFGEYISSAIKKCHVVLAVIGSGWWGKDDATGRRRLDDPGDFVRAEIEAAIQNNIPVIPLLINGVSMPDEAELPEAMKRLAFCNGISVRRDPDFHRDMDALISGLERLGFQRQDTSPAAGPVDLPPEVFASLHVDEEIIHIHQVPFTIGRHRSNALTLAGSSVSKRHARIIFVDDTFYLEDLGSTNGVYLLHERKEIRLEADKPSPLIYNTCFRLGKKDSDPHLTFEIEGEEGTFQE